MTTAEKTADTAATKKVRPQVLLSAVPCGFCGSADHDLCAGRIRNASKEAITGQWQCGCGCPTSVQPKCMDCQTRDTDAVNPETWTCFDEYACQARRQAKRDANPVFQNMIRIEKEFEMASAATKAAKNKTATEARIPAQPKSGVCIFTGRATKGGKFAPGQDAAYVSSKVKSVLAKETTKSQVLKEMDGHGLSDALKAKFEKGLSLAQEKAKAASAK